MPGFTLTENIQASPESVFLVAIDLRNAAEICQGIKSIEVLTEGPITVGTRFRETRVMFGKEAVEEMTVTALEPPHHFALGCENHGCRYHTEWRFADDAGGTKVELHFEATPLNFFAKAMAFLMKPLLNSCAKETKKDLGDLKAAVEGGADAVNPLGT